MKRALGWAAHAACVLSVVMAIWVPIGGRGQWIATAVLLLLLGAMLLGSVSAAPDQRPEAEAVPLREGEVLQGTGDPELDRKLNTRPQYGQKGDPR